MSISDRPLTILHVADGFLSFKEKAAFQIGIAGKLSAGFIRNGHQVIEFPYRQLSTGIFNSYRSIFGLTRVKHLLRKAALNIRPDVILFGHAYCFDNTFLKTLRKELPGTVFASWNQDSILEEDNLEHFIQRAEVMDANFITTSPNVLISHNGVHPGFHDKIHYLPLPVDNSVERGEAFKSKTLPIDVFCAVGNDRDLRKIAGQEEDMNDFAKYLKSKLPETTKYGFAGFAGKPTVYGADYRKLLEASAIGLNLSRPGDIPFYSSDRLTHIIGNGMLAAIERSSGFAELLGEDALLAFSSKDELADKLTFFIKNPGARQKAARKGYEIYQKWFDSAKVADYILGVLYPEQKAKSLTWLAKITKR